MRSLSDPDDSSQIFFSTFTSLLSTHYGITLSPSDSTNLLDSFPGRDEGPKKRLNVARLLYDQKYNLLLKKMYEKVDVHENDGEDDPVDEAGYLG